MTTPPLPSRRHSAPVTRSDWWETPAGRAARKHLEAWGAVEQVREATGDPAAVPCPIDGYSGGSRSFGMPDVLNVWAEVDQWVRNLEADELRLIRFVYVQGLSERSCVQFVLPDGTVRDAELEDEAWRNPPAVWREVRRATVRVLDYDMRRFEDEDLTRFCRRWNIGRTGFLEARHRSIAKALADDLALV